MEEKKEVKKDSKPSLRYMRDKDREPVKGIFRFYETPGGTIKFPYRAYKEDEVETFELTDGKVHTIPLGVAKHLNKNGWYPVSEYAMDEEGKHIVRVGQKIRRFGFQSLEFVDIDDLSEVGKSGIVTVERAL